MVENQHAELSIRQAKKILEGGNLSELKNKIEGDFFEAKFPKPYAIDSTNSEQRFSARIELASDIAAIANDNGGYIVCGLRTEPEKGLQTDCVKEINPFPKNDFYSQGSIQEVVNAHIFPNLKVTVAWHPVSPSRNIGIGSIFVPPQSGGEKPFIVTAAEINGNKRKHFISIPIRQGSNPVWMTAKQIHEIAVSKKPNSLKEVHDSLSGQIAELREIIMTNKQTLTPANDIQRKIKEVLDAR